MGSGACKNEGMPSRLPVALAALAASSGVDGAQLASAVALIALAAASPPSLIRSRRVTFVLCMMIPFLETVIVPIAPTARRQVVCVDGSVRLVDDDADRIMRQREETRIGRMREMRLFS